MASARFHGNVRNLCPGRFGDNIGSSRRTTRLVQDLREEKGLVSSISVSNMTQRLGGVFSISAQLATENLAAVEAAIVQHIRTLQTELVTDAEISRIRTQVANRFIFGNETPRIEQVCTVTISRW